MNNFDIDDEPAFSLNPPAVSCIADPVFADAVEQEYDQPVVGAPTTDPNRYTVHVPFHNTVLSLGKESARWIHDDGITGKTEEHIHFEVTKEEKTLISLGGPATASGLGNFQGDGIPTVKSRGFTMITEANAWLESKEQMYMLSSEHDVTLRAAGEEQTVTIQADTGKFQAFAGENATVVSKHGVTIGADPAVEMHDCHYKEPWQDAWRKAIYAKVGSTVALAGEVVTSAVAIRASFSNAVKGGKGGEAGWAEHARLSTPSKVKLIADGALFLSTVIRGANEVRGYEPPGTTAVYASNLASLTAGVGASVYGNVAAAVVSPGQAELLGGLSALVKGLIYTEIAGGLVTALTAIKNVEIAASKGEIEMSAKEEVKISSLDSELILTAEKDAQLTSVKKSVFVHGPTGAYVGAGKDDGYGINAKGGGIHVGKFSSVKEFESPSVVADECIYVGKKSIRAEYKSSKLWLKESETELKSDKITIKGSGDVKMDGGKILIG